MQRRHWAHILQMESMPGKWQVRLVTTEPIHLMEIRLLQPAAAEQ